MTGVKPDRPTSGRGHVTIYAILRELDPVWIFKKWKKVITKLWRIIIELKCWGINVCTYLNKIISRLRYQLKGKGNKQNNKWKKIRKVK